MDTAVKPQGCTNLKLRQLMRRVATHYDAEVGKTGLKGTQYSLLSYVVKLGPVRPAGRLATACWPNIRTTIEPCRSNDY